MYICLCNGVTESQIREAIGHGAHSLPALRGCLGVASNCGRCAEFAEMMLQETLSSGNPQLQRNAA